MSTLQWTREYGAEEYTMLVGRPIDNISNIRAYYVKPFVDFIGDGLDVKVVANKFGVDVQLSTPPEADRIFIAIHTHPSKGYFDTENDAKLAAERDYRMRVAAMELHENPTKAISKDLTWRKTSDYWEATGTDWGSIVYRVITTHPGMFEIISSSNGNKFRSFMALDSSEYTVDDAKLQVEQFHASLIRTINLKSGRTVVTHENPTPELDHDKMSTPAKMAFWVGSIATIMWGSVVLAGYVWPSTPTERLDYRGIGFDVNHSGISTWVGSFAFGNQTYSVNGTGRDDVVTKVQAQIDALSTGA